MEIIKSVFGKIAYGFLFGFGFILAAAVFGSYAAKYMTESTVEEVTEDLSRSDMFKEYDETAMLETHVKTEKIGDGAFVLLGEVKNSGEFSWQMINLQADLYNKDGQFIEQCTEYVSQTVRPGQIVNFKLSCRSSSCNTVSVNGYDSYVLKIADARYIRENRGN